MRLPDRSSPWYLVWVAVSTAVVMIVFTAIFYDDGIDWVLVVLITLAALVGTMIGNWVVRRSRPPSS